MTMDHAAAYDLFAEYGALLDTFAVPTLLATPL